MPFRRARLAPRPVDAYDVASAQLAAIREAHETCTEGPADCRAGISWATSACLAEHSLGTGPTRSLLLDHAAAVNNLLERRSAGRVSGLIVDGARLQTATACRAG
jgi:hypothetical protein